MRNIRRIYFVICGVLICLLFYIIAGFHRDVTSVYQPEESMSQVEYPVSFQEGRKICLQGVIGPSNVRDRYLVFYTGHYCVSVVIGGEVVYKVMVPDNAFGNTPGSGWNFVALKESQVGKNIEIMLESAYDETSGRIPVIYDGSKYMIIRTLLIQDLPSIIICGLTILIGIAILIYCAVIKVKGSAGESVLTLTYLGLFAAIMGIWSGNEVSSMSFIFGQHMFPTYLAYISLMLMVMPFMLFTRDMFVGRDHILWKISCILSLADLIGTTVLQILQIRDYRTTLWCMHILCILFMGVVVYMAAKEGRAGILTREMKINVVSLFLIIIGFVFDLFFFLKNGMANIFGRVCFLAYILILCYMFTRDIADLTRKGKEAEMYHKLAFTDALTGVWNRTAYSRNIAQFDQDSLEKVQVFVMDLNNLKWCNDNMGHPLGDSYIIHAASFIQQLFSKDARVYRIGGDEFCVLTKDMGEKDILYVFELLQEKKIEVKAKGEDKIFYGRIACGFDHYQEGDEDVYQIAKRADTKMYEKKRELKEKDDFLLNK